MKLFNFKRKNKILAVVKFNECEAFVMKYPIKLEYTKYDKIIIGTDGMFVSCFFHEEPMRPFNSNWSGWQAFGGRKFDLQLTDGTIEHCYGQWWDGGYNVAAKILKSEIVDSTAQDIKSLKECYVYIGYSVIKKELDKLRKRYKGKVYKYHEYDALITKNIHRRRSLYKEHKSLQLFFGLVKAEIVYYLNNLKKGKSWKKLPVMK